MVVSESRVKGGIRRACNTRARGAAKWGPRSDHEGGLIVFAISNLVRYQV